jgi:predicted Zn finger-like uncharacterized protein
MEVLCEHCQTEYDFDDALVSERGTTVKCTHCGHQFRIYRRPESASSMPERWEVRTSGGGDLVFTSLRDLQRAITRGQVGRSDVLTRGGLPSRPVSEIAELAQFFPEEGRVPRFTSDRPMAAPFESRPPIPSIHREDDESDFDEATVPKISAGTDRTLSTREVLGEEPGFEPATQRRPGLAETPAPPAVAVGGIKPLDQVEIREGRPLAMTPTPSDVRMSYASTEEGFTDPRFVTTPARRSGAIRWVAGVVVVGALGILAATVGRSYFEKATESTAGITVDPRIAGLLESGHEQLREGDWESAKASFDKASVLAENDPHVLLALAQLTNIRSDQTWLKTRLIDPSEKEVLRITQSELDTRTKQAIAASSRVEAQDDPESIAVRVDAFRLAGEISKAKALAAKISPHAGKADIAYVLAALEMCENKPDWPVVIERLRTSVSSEHGLGRARAALIYALAQAGQAEAAQAELATLEKQTRPHALLLDLKAFVARVSKEGPVSSAKPTGPIDPSHLPPMPGANRDGPDRAGDDKIAAGSYQDLLARGHAARQRGDLDSAEQFYRAALAKNPGDTEALAGLGDVAKARGDKSASMGYYEEVNKQNPGYVPALIGLADAKWDAGDKAGAVALYQQIVSQTGGQGPYAARARQRIAEASKPTEDPKRTNTSTDAAPP